MQYLYSSYKRSSKRNNKVQALLKYKKRTAKIVFQLTFKIHDGLIMKAHTALIKSCVAIISYLENIIEDVYEESGR